VTDAVDMTLVGRRDALDRARRTPQNLDSQGDALRGAGSLGRLLGKAD